MSGSIGSARSQSSARAERDDAPALSAQRHSLRGTTRTSACPSLP